MQSNKKGNTTWRQSLNLIVNAAIKEILFYQNEKHKTKIRLIGSGHKEVLNCPFKWLTITDLWVTHSKSADWELSTWMPPSDVTGASTTSC